MKTSELTGPALDWAVAKCEGRTDVRVDEDGELVGQWDFDYATDWSQGGLIIEREKITLDYDANVRPDMLWQAMYYAFDGTCLSNDYGPTPLIAAMRCFVQSHLGDTIDIPEELQ